MRAFQLIVLLSLTGAFAKAQPILNCRSTPNSGELIEVRVLQSGNQTSLQVINYREKSAVTLAAQPYTGPGIRKYTTTSATLELGGGQPVLMYPQQNRSIPLQCP